MLIYSGHYVDWFVVISANSWLIQTKHLRNFYTSELPACVVPLQSNAENMAL